MVNNCLIFLLTDLNSKSINETKRTEPKIGNNLNIPSPSYYKTHVKSISCSGISLTLNNQIKTDNKSSVNNKSFFSNF